MYVKQIMECVHNFLVNLAVLSDPQLRAIYDTTGVKGLETNGWQVGVKEINVSLCYP